MTSRNAGTVCRFASPLPGQAQDGYCRAPCDECPWRLDRPGKFPAERYRKIANVAYDASFSLFACHKSRDDRPVICAGFLLRGAVHNLSVRLRLARGSINMVEVSDGGHDLHVSYREMAVANGVAPDDPALARCRT